jgi:ABC-2 type transport system ATP-binding protein
MIETEELTRWYGDFLALDHLNLRLEAGDLFGFIGPNGAGKTTTMKILATLMSPSSGRALVGGVDVVKEPDKVRRMVGYMPDFFGVYQEMRAAEYLAFFAAAYDVPSKRRDQTVKDLLALVDLSHKAEDTVGALSRGMQQRLGLARALVHDPQVLILDEPASGLDPRARFEMREVLRELSQMGKTIILSSHILPELASLCTRIGVIARGTLLASGTIEEVSSRVSSASVLVRLGEREGHELALDLEAASALLGERLGATCAAEEGGALRLSSEGALDPGEVAAALVGAGLRLRQLQVEQASLEEIFLRLTHELDLGQEAAGAGEGA